MSCCLLGSRLGHSPMHVMPFSRLLAEACVAMIPMQELLMEGPVRHMESLDCIRCLPGSRLATKSRDGRMCIWDLATRTQLCAWKVCRSCMCH